MISPTTMKMEPTVAPTSPTAMAPSLPPAATSTALAPNMRAPIPIVRRPLLIRRLRLDCCKRQNTASPTLAASQLCLASASMSEAETFWTFTRYSLTSRLGGWCWSRHPTWVVWARN